MILTLSIIVAIALGICAAWVLGSPKQQPDRAAEACWRGFAELMEFDYDPGGMLQGPQIVGDQGNLSVTCDTFYQSREGRKSLFTRIVVSGDSVPESLDGFQKAKSGDPPAKRLLAQVTRRYARELVKHIGATVANGKVKWVRDGAVWNPQQTAKTLRRILEITRFLSVDVLDEASRLLLCYQDEALPEATKRDIQRLLFTEFRGTDACEAVASEIVDGRDPELQVGAAKALGERGLPTLANIARNRTINSETRQEAVLGLCAYPEPGASLPFLANVLRDKSTETVRIAASMLKRKRFVQSLPLLAEIASDSSTPNEALVLIIDLLASIGNSSIETILLGLLEHQFVTIRRRTCRALADVGSGSALPHLDRVVQKRTENRKVKELAIAAQKKIRDRHGIERKPAAEAV